LRRFAAIAQIRQFLTGYWVYVQLLEPQE